LPEERGSYLALFNGVMTGEVKNPVTGRVYPRREMMEFYRLLLFKACQKPIDEKTIDMLEMVRSFLEVPSDIHLSLLIEARDSSLDPPQMNMSEAMRADMDITYSKWMAQHIAHQETIRGLFREFKEESMEVERNSLLREDYQVIQVAKGIAHSSKTDDLEVKAEMLPPNKGKALRSFQERFLQP